MRLNDMLFCHITSSLTRIPQYDSYFLFGTSGGNHENSRDVQHVYNSRPTADRNVFCQY